MKAKHMKTIATIRATTSEILPSILPLLAAITLVTLTATGSATPNEPESAKLPAALPRVNIRTADKLGLQRWRDLDTGKEIRRAQPVNTARLTIHTTPGNE
jgi:hypothetical protein